MNAQAQVDVATARTKIKHVVVIMQENRSFDSYFGTFPGADGIPRRGGRFTVCLPDPRSRHCERPYHDASLVNNGGPHGAVDVVADVDGGKMDGFLADAERHQDRCGLIGGRQCRGTTSDVLGFHDAREIPNYWNYAKHYVLQDHLFQPNASWSLPQHLFMVSEWSAFCPDHDPMNCRNALQKPALPVTPSSARVGPYAWTDLTYLLHRHHVSWRYYVQSGNEPDCRDDAAECAAAHQDFKTPGIWNPLPSFNTVHLDGELGDVASVERFFTAARRGHLPQVSWITPGLKDSEHPRSLISDGQAWVTSLVDAIMRGPDWRTTAIFVSWDDWGGFYDHVHPPKIDENGYGLRVPGLLISPYARHGFVDHQTLSHDAYTKLIEDLFLDGTRIDPATDGRPDRRPDVREAAPALGDLLREFDFHQTPRPPLLLRPRPALRQPPVRTALTTRPPQ